MRDLGRLNDERIVFRFGHQPRLDWIQPDVIPLFQELSVVADNAVEVFFLPERSGCSTCELDFARGMRLDAVHQFRQGVPRFAVLFYQRRDDQVDVIRHDHREMKMQAIAMPVQTGVNNHLTLCMAQFTLLQTEGHEVRAAADLPMWKTATVRGQLVGDTLER